MASYRHRIAEGAVKDFPAIKRDYDGYRLMLDAKALAGGCLYGERVDGGEEVYAGDRYLGRYDDPVMRSLWELVYGIYEPYCKLPEEERRILALRYWQKMEVPDVAAELMFSNSTVYRHISRALGKLYRPVLDVQPLLEDWRMGALK